MNLFIPQKFLLISDCLHFNAENMKLSKIIDNNVNLQYVKISDWKHFNWGWNRGVVTPPVHGKPLSHNSAVSKAGTAKSWICLRLTTPWFPKYHGFMTPRFPKYCGVATLQFLPGSRFNVCVNLQAHAIALPLKQQSFKKLSHRYHLLIYIQKHLI